MGLLLCLLITCLAAMASRSLQLAWSACLSICLSLNSHSHVVVQVLSATSAAYAILAPFVGYLTRHRGAVPCIFVVCLCLLTSLSLSLSSCVLLWMSGIVDLGGQQRVRRAHSSARACHGRGRRQRHSHRGAGRLFLWYASLAFVCVCVSVFDLVG